MLLGPSPFDDPSGQALLVWLAQQGITPEGAISGDIIPTQDSVFSLGDSTHTWANVWGNLIGQMSSPSGTYDIILGDSSLAGILPDSIHFIVPVNTNADFALIEGITQYNGFFNLAFPSVHTNALVVTGFPGLLDLGNSANPLGNVVAQGSIKLKSGANLKAGTFTANGSTAVVVSTTAVTANSVIITGLKTVGGTPAGAPFMSAVTPGTSFSMKAAVGDTSVYNYMILDLF